MSANTRRGSQRDVAPARTPNSATPTGVPDVRAAYREAGVDVALGEAAVARIRPIAMSTAGPEVLEGLGGFAGLFALSTRLKGLRDPVLVAGADGVGTKLALAEELRDYRTVGTDLVAMCVNDVAAAGGDPLFFLDYIATDRLDPEAIETVIASMADALRSCDTALLGGEMAEMPGFYPAGRMDLAGFCVGLADRADLLGPQRTCIGDRLIGLASSGLHSNGFSLVRSILAQTGQTLSEPLPAYDGASLGSVLLAPTRLYTQAVRVLRTTGALHSACHITGGGFQGNLPRILPSGTVAHVDLASFTPPAIFGLLGRLGEIPLESLFATFNMGVGFVLAVDPASLPEVLAELRGLGEDPIALGSVEDAPLSGAASSAGPVRFTGSQDLRDRLGLAPSRP